MSQRITQHKGNFTSGELKKSLHAREDLGFYNNGAKRIENMIVLPEGGLTRRPGTRFVLELFDEDETGELIPFKFSRDDARMLCLNGGKGRVFKSGGFVESAPGAPYQFDQPWSAAELSKLRWFEVADLTFVADGAQPKLVSRLADDDWTIADYAHINGPVRPQNVDIAKTIAVSALTGSIDLTANFDIFDPGHVGSIWRLDESDLSLVPYWTASESVTTGGAPAVSYRRYRGNVYKAKPPPGVVAGGAHDCGVNPPIQTFGDSQSQPDKIVWEFLYAGYGYVRITAVADAQHATADVIGVSRSSQTALPDSLLSKPTYRWYEAAWSSLRGFPELVSYAQTRIAWFDHRGQFWITYAGDYYDFQFTPDDSSAIVGQMLSIDGSVVQPQWALSNGWILVGASEGEPLVRGPGAYDAITKSNILAITDKGQGSCPQIPAVCDGGVAFIGASRRRLHYIKTNRLIDSINVDEISVASNHILKGMAARVVYQRDPHHLLWGYSQDGALWAYTFRPDQQVVGAHRHPMANAFVESAGTIPAADGELDELWLIVRRVIGGVTRRFVEVLQPFFEPQDDASPTAQGAWFYDCALRYVGPPATTLSGLDHLKGASVGIFFNGQDLPRQLVSEAGSVSLPEVDVDEYDVVVGLPIPFKLQTLDLSPAAQGRTTRGGVKQASHAALDILDGYGLDVLADNGEGPLDREVIFESGDAPPAGAPMPLFTGRKTFPIDGAHGYEVNLIAQGDHGYPMTILGLAPDIELMES